MAGNTWIETLDRAARHAELRMRVARMVAVLPTSGTIALAATGGIVALRKVFPEHVEERIAWAVVVGAAASVLLALGAALLRRLPPRAGALALDRFHGLDGRLSNALAFGALPVESRSTLMTLSIDDACRAAAQAPLRPTGAVRIPVPGELGVTALVAMAVVGLSLLEVRTVRPPVEPAKLAHTEALAMSDDDLDLFRQAVDEVDRDDQSPEVKAAVERFNQLIEDIANRRLSRDDAFRRMREIEDDLLRNAEQEKKALDEALKEMAKELQKSDLSKPAADALKKNDMAAAQQAVKRLADQLRGKEKKKPDKADLERLRHALERASKANKEALERVNEQRAELDKQLLKKKNEPKPENKEDEERDKRLLDKKKRELERLDREAERREQSGRRLSRLDRQLAKAAADLLRDLGASADDLEGLAEDLNRLEQEQMTDKEKEELRQRLQELRELIRQQGQGGEKLRQRLQRFMKRARGAQGGGGRGGGKGGQQGEGDEDGELRPGGKEGQGRDGEGQGEGSGEGSGLELGPGSGGKKISVEMPGGSGRDGSGAEPGGGAPAPSKGWGVGSTNPLGDKSEIKGEAHDVRAEGLDNQKGPTNAQVIQSAAQRGFVGRPYRSVYKQYRTVAEDQIDREKIPDGMRFYVRRYFQLIRPRE